MALRAYVDDGLIGQACESLAAREKAAGDHTRVYCTWNNDALRTRNRTRGTIFQLAERTAVRYR